jgi:hypothetical protein
VPHSVTFTSDGKKTSETLSSRLWPMFNGGADPLLKETGQLLSSFNPIYARGVFLLFLFLTLSEKVVTGSVDQPKSTDAINNIYNENRTPRWDLLEIDNLHLQVEARCNVYVHRFIICSRWYHLLLFD